MIPICLVTGFLGSGKSTLLRRLIADLEGRRVAFLINEFSQLDVDGRSMVEATASHQDMDVRIVPGGSIFCKCLVASFIDQLSALVNLSEARHPLEGIIIEASGVANPSVTQKMLHETGLDQDLSLASIVNVIDPATFPKLIHTLPNIREQAAGADLTIINKCDAHSSEALESLESLVREINPSTTLMRTSYGEVTIDPFPSPIERPMLGELAKCRDPNYERLIVRFDQTTSSEQIQTLLESLRPSVYRCKGLIETPNGLLWIDATAEDVQTRPHDPDALEALGASASSESTPEAESLGLAVILQGGQAERVKEAFTGLPGASVEQPDG